MRMPLVHHDGFFMPVSIPGFIFGNFHIAALGQLSFLAVDGYDFEAFFLMLVFLHVVADILPRGLIASVRMLVPRPFFLTADQFLYAFIAFVRMLMARILHMAADQLVFFRIAAFVVLVILVFFQRARELFDLSPAFVRVQMPDVFFLGAGQKQHIHIARIGMGMARILLQAADQLFNLFFALVGMNVHRPVFQPAYVVPLRVLAVLVMDVIIAFIPRSVPALILPLGVFAGVRVLMNGVVRREDADRFFHRVPFLFRTYQNRRIAPFPVLMRFLSADRRSFLREGGEAD